MTPTIPQLQSKNNKSRNQKKISRSASLKNLRESSLFEEKQGEVTTSLINYLIGSYGVVFKAVKNDENDVDESGKRKSYAIKRIFPTINAAFILIEMLILKLLKQVYLIIF